MSFHKEHMRGIVGRAITVFAIASGIAILIFSFLYQAGTSGKMTAFSENIADNAPITETPIDSEKLANQAPQTTDMNETSEQKEKLKETPVVAETPKTEEAQKEVITRANVDTISVEELAFSIVNNKGEIIYDIRNLAAFQQGHVRTSVHYPLSDLKVSDFQEGKSYILVCQKTDCTESKQLVDKVKGQKINLLILQGGFEAWQGAGMKIVKD